MATAVAIATAAGKGEIVPNPIDPRAHTLVAHSVARAAMDSGVAQQQLDDDYFESANAKDYVWE
ncbi:MAG: hypothetical protein FJZ88_02560 [Chloroflexi bacterium]|nr:hypothetical protein [Chloroflexota bacterium]